LTYSFDPKTAPHRPIVEQCVLAHMPPLHRRLRQRQISAFVDELLAIERNPAVFQQPQAQQLALLCDRSARVAAIAEDQRSYAARNFASFAQRFGKAGPDLQTTMTQDYLRATVSDESRLREDLLAMRRNLGFEALRERNLAALLDRTIATEIALWFMSLAIPTIIADPSAAMQLSVEPMLDVAIKQIDVGTRWQVRWAAGHALEACAKLVQQQRNASQDASADDDVRPPLRLPTSLLATLDDVATRLDEHPWVQSAALYSAMELVPSEATQRVEQSLAATTSAFDFYRRKLVLRRAIDRLAIDDAVRIVTSRVFGHEPSEHVRLGVAEFAGQLLRRTMSSPRSSAQQQVSDFLVALSTPIEPSFRVRAKACTVLSELVRQDKDLIDCDRAISAILAATGDTMPFTTIVACEELTSIADYLTQHQDHDVQASIARWLPALHLQMLQPGLAPHAAESIAACAEHLFHLSSPERRALIHTLTTSLRNVPAGKRTSVKVDAKQSANDIVRGLSHLTRRDWGASARLRGTKLTLWRGDRFRRRLWRVAHELRHPLPNKRQAFWHTLGRTYPGPLRAHPGLLDEATATTVPGERVTVDSEGSWGRHLPSVDDALDAAVSSEPITLASSYGFTPPTSRWRRLRNRLALAWHYRDLAALRLTSLGTYRDRFRRRYIEELASKYGINVAFVPHERQGEQPLPADVAGLFEHTITIGAAPEPAATVEPTASVALAVPVIGGAIDWLSANQSYLRSPSQNSQAALVAFGAGMSALFFSRAWQKRRQVERARKSIPLTIGGWGTRGKSGTERLKAGMFDGLGFDVFVKTTGCEAMFIHSAPMQQPVEIFIYRPYDKATIWEQKALLELAARFQSQVMMWECMALNPKYVQLLQHEWMNDDLVTLTNCYPDHEDIQGPAGFNVAQVITEFIPTKSTLITSEATYLPMFEDIAKKRGTIMHTVGERQAEFIGEDALNLFPYREHPRNIALVTRMAEALGVDSDLARLTMAQYVVPDLGVLKAYPPATVRGRKLTFVCGNSANERTGFINNWRRMKLDQLNLETDPDKLVITVVNNRADRIARSEVFARILVRDVAFDRHVLIGTNLEGLQGFLATALDTYLAEQSLVESDELVRGTVVPAVAARLQREFGNLRIPVATSAELLRRLRIFARATNRTVLAERESVLQKQLDAILHSPGTSDFTVALSALTSNSSLRETLLSSLTIAAETATDPESLEPATTDDVISHVIVELARMQVRARLEAHVQQLFANPSDAARNNFVREFKLGYRTMFMAQVVVIADSDASGDQIIDRCARSVPPGCDVVLMGTQNIKGTGLDFVYRWLAMDKVVTCIKDIDHPRAERRSAATAELESFEDYGLIDTGLLRAALARPEPEHLTDDDRVIRARIASKVNAIWQSRRTALVEQKRASWIDRLAGFAEGGLDWADSVRRARGSKQILDDLVDQRITHAKASVEMRKLVGRAKGGWLAKAIKLRKAGS
jgi:gamma-polyglutamate synthase